MKYRHYSKKWMLSHWKTDLPSQKYIHSQVAIYQTQQSKFGYLRPQNEACFLANTLHHTSFCERADLIYLHGESPIKIERQGLQPSAYDYSLGTTLQQWPLGHGKKQGRAQQWSHTTITEEPNPPSRLFVGVKPRDLASQWLWGFQHATEAKQHTPDQISAMCGVTLGPNQTHVHTYSLYYIYFVW